MLLYIRYSVLSRKNVLRNKPLPSAGVRVGFTAKYSYEFKLKAENEYINAEKKHDYAAKKHNMISYEFNKKLNRPTVRILMPTDRRPSEFSLP